ncbi:hypothetical protein ENUP19_0331G0007 [Entamoeba nuttalli]|uniref:H-type lectin domain containing protein n=2 Tax=Entamoeba nuttalli TaxID=412467 RepID=K2GYL0_ENTNP|nr:H-type lectin domain containing protein [Entamoeba nuttalli P19]EKE40343.1 H-type lectin domain containing protein [Entamoeba nuttalli P19]|eukprot:XP_008857325.1 H-type lectin domain containing protein [Entamoeba nuttalli P19]
MSIECQKMLCNISTIDSGQMSIKESLSQQYQQPCWFWGISKFDIEQSDISFVSALSVTKTGVTCDVIGEKEISSVIEISYIVFEEILPIYSDSIEITNCKPVKITFNSTFKEVPKVIISIQSISALNLSNLTINVIKINKNFCQIQAQFNDYDIQSLTVGILAYDICFSENKITELLMGNNIIDETKQIQIMSGSFKYSNSNINEILLKNYAILPQVVSFITGFSSTTINTWPIQMITYPKDPITICIKAISGNDCEWITSDYFICSSLNREENNQFHENNFYINGFFNGVGGINNNQNIIKPKCKDILKETDDNICWNCKKHYINTIFNCGHCCYCYCCSKTLGLTFKCPKCNKISVKPVYFEEFQFESIN